MKKRFLPIALALCVTLILLPTAVLAAGDLTMLKGTYLSNDQYYYNQLSAEHKEAWEFVIANVLSFPTRNAASTRNSKYQALARMIMADNPRIFWVDWIDSYGELRYDTGSLSTDPAYYEPAWPSGETLAQLQAKFLAAIPADVAEIRASLPESPTAYDKVKAIHDWLCDNNTYNSNQTSSHKKEHDPVLFDYLAAHSAYSAIVTGDAYEPVCEGYSAAFKILCEEFDVECICVSGTATQSNGRSYSHMWNYVKMEDGKWYLVDVTNDDPDSENPIYYNFFLCGTEQNSQTYAPDAYLGSGIKTEADGAQFTFPDLPTVWWYVIPPEITASNEYGGKKITLSGRNESISSSSLYMYYTEDGSAPTESSQSAYHYQEQAYGHTFSKEFWISSDKTVKAMLRVGSDSWARKSYSAVTSLKVQVDQTEAPEVSVNGGAAEIRSPGSATADVRIYYTVNGTEPQYVGGSAPSIVGTLYSDGFTVQEGDVIQAIAVDKGCAASGVVSHTVEHTHNFSYDWSSDENEHWRICTGSDCSEVTDRAAHSWNTGEVTTQPTYEDAGLKTVTCTACQRTRTETVPRLEHHFSTDWTSDETYHWYACTDPGYTSLVKDKNAHAWDDGTITTEPTAEAEGIKTYTCTICGRTKMENIGQFAVTATLIGSGEIGAMVQINAPEELLAGGIRVIAACHSNEKMVKVAFGEFLPDTQTVRFSQEVSAEWTLFILNPDTYAPLCGKIAIRQA